jgi:aminoglycoside 6'-N-acetyltransferase
MSGAGTGYGFRPMTVADLPLVCGWLDTPDVRRWWGDPEEQIALLREDLDEPRMAMWIVSYERSPFAYIQDYDPCGWALHHFGALPAGSRGIDQFIGEPDMLDRGHGPAFIRAHVERLFAQGSPAVGVDPDPANARAIRAYEKAGFRTLRETADQEGARVLLMVRGALDVAWSRSSVPGSPRPETLRSARLTGRRQP